MTSHSLLRMRRPSRSTRTLVVVGTPRAALNKSTVSRAGMKSGDPQSCSSTQAANPTIDGPLR
jgi:hypothetical protein